MIDFSFVAALAIQLCFCSFSLLTIFYCFFGVREPPLSVCLAQRKRTKRKGTFSLGIF